MANKTHAHKLKRLKYKSGNIIYHCVLPDCTIKVAPALTLGKRAICWRCGKEFLMTDYSIRLAKPHCEDCHKPKSSSTMEVEIPVSHVQPVITDVREIGKNIEPWIRSSTNEAHEEIEEMINIIEQNKETEAGKEGKKEIDSLMNRMNRVSDEEDI